MLLDVRRQVRSELVQRRTTPHTESKKEQLRHQGMLFIWYWKRYLDSMRLKKILNIITIHFLCGLALQHLYVRYYTILCWGYNQKMHVPLNVETHTHTHHIHTTYTQNGIWSDHYSKHAFVKPPILEIEKCVSPQCCWQIRMLNSILK